MVARANQTEFRFSGAAVASGLQIEEFGGSNGTVDFADLLQAEIVRCLDSPYSIPRFISDVRAGRALDGSERLADLANRVIEGQDARSDEEVDAWAEALASQLSQFQD
jgi:hypothetical protein